MGGLLHLVQRRGDWTGLQPAQAPPRCTKCNSPPINGHCTNFVIFDVALQLPLESKGLNTNWVKDTRFLLERGYVTETIHVDTEFTDSPHISCNTDQLSLMLLSLTLGEF